MNEKKLNGVLEHIRHGKPVIVTDDESRENEGDFICSAALIDSATVNFMLKNGRGVLCCPLPESRADKLGLLPMCGIEDGCAAFTVSVDAKHGISTGVSAGDRAFTLRLLASEEASAESFSRPGHIFPLRAKTEGLKVREGHTEAAVELMKLAGLPPVAVLIEILNEDGSMARLADLKLISQKQGIPLVSIEEIKGFLKIA